MPSLITTVISFCRSRPASGSLRQSIASSDQTSYPYLKWLNGVSDAYAASPLAQGTTGMLRAAYAYCGLPAFVSLSMAGSGCVCPATWRLRQNSTPSCSKVPRNCA
ncbi:MAG: hypothetical protein FE835_18820 [Gammaproteobacteria bacterium]|nr:hypothetical protein [Gammaproteobacteria bacterium]